MQATIYVTHIFILLFVSKIVNKQKCVAWYPIIICLLGISRPNLHNNVIKIALYALGKVLHPFPIPATAKNEQVNPDGHVACTQTVMLTNLIQ